MHSMDLKRGSSLSRGVYREPETRVEPKRAIGRERTGIQDEETPDLGSRALSPPTTCQVIPGELQGEWQPEPLNQFKQEELVFIMRSIIRANCDYLNNSCA